MIGMIFDHEELRVFHTVVLDNYETLFKMLKRKDQASYVNFVKYTGPNLMRIAGLQSPCMSLLKDAIDSFAKSSSYAVFSVHIDLLSKYLQRYGSAEKREMLLTERVMNWLDTKRDLDSYNIALFYEAWRSMLLSFEAFQALGNIVAIQYMKQIPHFYIEILLLSRTLNYLNEKSNKERIANFNDDILMAQAAISNEKYREAVSCMFVKDYVSALKFCYD